jgi:hypothetical protein
MKEDLELGETYLLFRDGEFIGEAVWTNDKNIGHNFIAEEVRGREKVNVVYIADSWIKKNK